jgi:non-homologous end joining protein Ku
MSSSSNINLTIAGFTFGVKLMSIARPQKFSVDEIHESCQTPIGYEQTCPHCRSKIFQPEPMVSPPLAVPTPNAGTATVQDAVPPALAPAARVRAPAKAKSEVPVAGGKAQTPKRLHCPNGKCGKEIAGQAIERPFCKKCNQCVGEGEVVSAYKVDGALVVLSNEELEAIRKLRLERGIEILDARRDWTPSWARIDDVYQLVPDKGSELAFCAFVRATQQTGYTYSAAVCTKDEKVELTLCFEYMAVIMLDTDSQTLLMVTLHAERDVKRINVPELDVAKDLLHGMMQLQHGFHKPFDASQVSSLTPAAEALRAALEAKRTGGEFVIPPPRQISREMVAVVAQMRQVIEAATKKAPKEKAKGNKKSKKAEATKA